MKKIPTKVAVIAGGSLAALALGTGVAHAASNPAPSPTNPLAVSTATPGNHTPATSAQPEAPDTGGQAEAPDTGTQAETPDTGNQAADAPGGHADPAGNVDHQFQGNE